MRDRENQKQRRERIESSKERIRLQRKRRESSRVTEKINRVSVLSLKRRRFGLVLSRPVLDSTRTKTVSEIFFLAENRYIGGTHAAVPQQYPYPRGTWYGYDGVFAVPVLPRLECILLKIVRLVKY